jgi:hypothetical protein
VAALSRHALIVALLVGNAVADECVDQCTAVQPESAPTCEEYNVCSDLYHVDPAGYDSCMARVRDCKERQERSNADQYARNVCADGGDTFECCTRACSDAALPAEDTGVPWTLVDAIGGVGGRSAEVGFGATANVGLIVEVLYGRARIHPPDLTPRFGPFIQATYDAERGGAGLQAAAGATLMFGIHRGQSTGAMARAVELSVGGVLDAPGSGATEMGGLARLSVGILPTGPNSWKPIDGFVYVESHLAVGRVEVLAGVRIALLSGVFFLVPAAYDW